ncbi:hypothetical protein QBC39DRAFT_139102 [Podospora conica]|nr:hypothetical protein QBC39DRAFT_139102 [Schizothecium conicum]
MHVGDVPPSRLSHLASPSHSSRPRACSADGADREGKDGKSMACVRPSGRHGMARTSPMGRSAGSAREMKVWVGSLPPGGSGCCWPRRSASSAARRWVARCTCCRDPRFRAIRGPLHRLVGFRARRRKSWVPRVVCVHSAPHRTTVLATVLSRWERRGKAEPAIDGQWVFPFRGGAVVGTWPWCWWFGWKSGSIALARRRGLEPSAWSGRAGVRKLSTIRVRVIESIEYGDHGRVVRFNVVGNSLDPRRRGPSAQAPGCPLPANTGHTACAGTRLWCCGLWPAVGVCGQW